MISMLNNKVKSKIIVQALRDSHLKIPIFGNAATKNGSANYDIKTFIADPLSFSKLFAISGDNMTKMGKLPPRGRAQFTKVSPHTYAVEMVYEPSKLTSELTVDAYFLGYNGANQSTKTPSFVDIPIQATENDFLFTGSLTGCSVIVTKHNELVYRVYHDGRVNSSVLYDNVVMAFDFRDYQVSGADEGLAMAYMRFKEGRWALILQRQEYEVIDGIPIPKLRTHGIIVNSLSPDEAFSRLNLERFNQYRNDVHQKLVDIAKYFNIDTTNIEDGVYLEGEFSSQHPAIIPWVKLQNEIKQHLNIEKRKIKIKIENARAEIVDLKNKKSTLNKTVTSDEDSVRIDELEKILEMNKELNEYYKQKYDSILSELLSVERSWLWLQIKKHYGEGAVVKIEEPRIKTGFLSNETRIKNQYEAILSNDIWMGEIEFNTGIENYNELSINGFNDEMSSSKMKELYIHGGLNIKDRGALSQQIKIKEKSEYIKNVLDFTLRMNTLFQKGGSIYQRVAPQDLYLSLMGDDSGRCYPLVRAMSVALALEGNSGADELLNKMFIAAASPEEKNSVILKMSLINLHSNLEAIEASTSLDLLDLKGIKKILIETDGTKMYALNTQSHSMLIGKKSQNGGVSYYFYDPNFGLYTFDSPKKLFSTLNDFLVKNKMAYQYDALGKISEPIFELISIDVQKMADVEVGSGVSVEDLVYSTDLEEVTQRYKKTKFFIEKQNSLAKDRQIQSSFSILKAEQWGARLELSVDKITQLHQLNENWLPVFASTDALDDGRYRIQFIHKGDESLPRWIETDDKTFFEFKEYFNQSIDTFSKHYSFNDLALQHEDVHGGVYDAEHVDGLNSAIGIRALIEWSANRNRQSVASGEPSNLDTALKIHAYVSYTMMAHGTLSDVSRVTRLVNTLWKEGSEVGKTVMNNFSSSFLRTANEGIGAVFQGTMVGLDIYELANAENEQQRAVFGTQLAFDSAALTTTIVGYGASLLGAETIAGVAMPLAVPLAGIGIGVTELVKINERHALKAAEVGAIFMHYKENYQNAAITYDAEKSLLIPTNGIVIDEIDFSERTFKLGSQYIYRGEERSWTLGYSALSDFQSSPRAEINKDNAINVREAVGVSPEWVNFDTTKSNAIVLPVVPKSYISYKYSTLFGATSRGDSGFSVLRNMEESYQFYFDYFYCGMEYVISQLSHEYVFTSINIILDPQNRHLIVPTLPESWHGHIEHVAIGRDGEYQITLNHGASLRLKQSSIGSGEPTWIIDTSFIDNNNDLVIQITDDHIKIGNTVVYVDDTAKSNQFRLVNSRHETREINFKHKTVDIISLNGKHWRSKELSIESFLEGLAKKGELHRQYVIINHYQHNDVDVGRAFYDVTAKRMLYTNSSNIENQSALLAGIISDTAYFYSEEEGVFWTIDINTGILKTRFNFLALLGNNTRIDRITLKNDLVSIELTNINRNSKVNITYHMENNQLALVSISNDRALMDKLHQTTTTIPLKQRKELLKHDYLVSANYIRSQEHGTEISQVSSSPTLAKIMMVKGTDYLGFTRFYWLRRDDGSLIKPNLEKPENYDQQLISDLSPSLRWFSSNANELAYMDRQLANRVPFEAVMGNTYAGFMTKAELLQMEYQFDVSGTIPTLLKIVGVRFKSFDPMTDTWNWQPPKDLTLVCSLFDDNGVEVFFFYSQQEDTIFRQEGLGQDIIDLHNPTAKRLNFNQIETVFNWQGNALVILKNGVVKQLNVDGSANIVALNKEWFENKLFNWENLNQFTNEDHPIALLGLKRDDGKQLLPAWYFKGKVIITQYLSSENDLQFLGFDQNTQSGIIFDSQTKKLYQQKAITNTELSDLFNENAVLKHPKSLPEQVELYPTAPLKSVKKMGGGLMVFTFEGQIIFHSLSSQGQLGSSLIIKGTKSDDILTPTQLKDVQTLILSGGEGKDTYQLRMDDWQRYQVIIVDNHSMDEAIDRLILPIKNNQNDLFINRHHDDLIITDSINQTSLILRDIYGANAGAKRHLMIQLDKHSFHVNDLADTLEIHRGAMYLSSYFEDKHSFNRELVLLADNCCQIEPIDSLSNLKDPAYSFSKLNSGILPLNRVQY